MTSRLVLVSCFAFLLSNAPAFAKEPKAYQDGVVLQMEVVPCAAANGAAEAHDTSGRAGKGQRECQEYLLQAEQVIYRIQQKSASPSSLIAVGERANFRIEKNKILVRAPAADSREHECVVVSITPRGDSTADANPVRLNHLQ